MFIDIFQKNEINKNEKKHKKRNKINDYKYKSIYHNLNDLTIYDINQQREDKKCEIENKNITENNIDDKDNKTDLEKKVVCKTNIFKISNESVDFNNNINNIHTQEENTIIKNKKNSNFFFSFCCGEDATDVID